MSYVEMSILKKKKLSTALRNQALNKKRLCLVDGCREYAISSHLLQKRGILDHIAVDQHLYEIGPEEPFLMQAEKIPIRYKRVGINNCLTLPLFCKGHDTQLFREIETGEVDHSAYKTQLLFAYRACAGELRKKQVICDMLGAMMNDQDVRVEATAHQLDRFSAHLQGFILGAKDSLWYKSELAADLEDLNRRSFTLATIESQPLDVGASAGFTPVDTPLNTDAKQEDPLPLVIANVIPRSTATYYIVGYHNEYATPWMGDYLQQCESANEEEIEHIISNLLIKRCETWAMSPRLYDMLSEKRRQQILEEFHKDIRSVDQNLHTHMNIFREMK